MLDKMASMMDRLLVYPDRMLHNLNLTGGLIYSGQLLLDLTQSGLTREEAYKLVQGHAMNAWENSGNFRSLVEADPEITERLPAERLAEIFDFKRQLENVDVLFERVFRDDPGDDAIQA